MDKCRGMTDKLTYMDPPSPLFIPIKGAQFIPGFGSHLLTNAGIAPVYTQVVPCIKIMIVEVQLM